MKHLGKLFLFVILVSTGALSQNYQVTNIHGTEIINPPVLDIQNNIARITYATNLRFYSFSANGPSTPMSPTSQPRSIGWGPINVAMKSNGNSIVICYVIQEDAPLGWYVEAVSSPDGGTTWTLPYLIEKVAPITSDYKGPIAMFYDNVVLDKSAGMGGTALLYYRVHPNNDTTLSLNRIHMVNNHGFGPAWSFVAPYPDSTHAPGNVSCCSLPNGPMNDYLYMLHSVDTSLYLITYNTQQPKPGAPVKILSITGSGSYFSRTKLVANSNGTMFLAFGFWQFIPGGGMMHSSNQGTVLYRSTNSGSTWSFVDTIAQSQYATFDLQMTTTGTLVHTKAENANVYVRSSLDGSHWSSFAQVNPTANTATGKNTFGMSAALVDDSNIGVAWIDTTTGNDEIFYRKMAIPTAPTVGVSESENLTLNKFALNQNYPNPFNPSTMISYQMPITGNVTLKVYDILGKEVATLVNETKEAGSYEVMFDASKFSSGIYFYRLQVGNFTAVKKLVLMK